MPPIVATYSLVAAIVYTLGVLCLKRATEWNPGPWRVTFLCNVATTLLFLPLWLLPGPDIDWSRWWEPAAVALLFVAGQILVVVALSRGDVSIATPLLGLKILLVTGLCLIAADKSDSQETWKLVSAATTATLAVGLLGTTGSGGKRRRLVETVITSFGAAACYAVFDVGLQILGPDWGTTRLMPAVMTWSGILSCSFIPFFEKPLSALPHKSLPWVATGAFLMAAQAIFLTCTITTYGFAAQANVVYSTRGLWTVLLIWSFGHVFSKQENAQDAGTLFRRLIGAALLSFAVLLVL
ncbi:MAG: hypothetical protein AAF989_02140 [Planctomycetota bacterium]